MTKLQAQNVTQLCIDQSSSPMNFFTLSASTLMYGWAYLTDLWAEWLYLLHSQLTSQPTCNSLCYVYRLRTPSFACVQWDIEDDGHHRVLPTKKSLQWVFGPLSELEQRGLVVNYYTLELGSLGHYLADAMSCISNTFELTNQNPNKSYSNSLKWLLPAHFNSRNSANWDLNKPFYCL